MLSIRNRLRNSKPDSVKDSLTAVSRVFLSKKTLMQNQRLI